MARTIEGDWEYNSDKVRLSHNSNVEMTDAGLRSSQDFYQEFPRHQLAGGLYDPKRQHDGFHPQQGRHGKLRAHRIPVQQQEGNSRGK